MAAHCERKLVKNILYQGANSTHETQKDDPRREHHAGAHHRDDLWRRGGVRAEGVLDLGERMEGRLVWVRRRGLRRGQDEVEETCVQGRVSERAEDQGDGERVDEGVRPVGDGWRRREGGRRLRHVLRNNV